MTPEAKAQHFILQLLKEGIIDEDDCCFSIMLLSPDE